LVVWSENVSEVERGEGPSSGSPASRNNSYFSVTVLGLFKQRNSGMQIAKGRHF
jgi:hypothetical protein